MMAVATAGGDGSPGWRGAFQWTVIASVVPRIGIGNDMLLMLFGPSAANGPRAAWLGNLCPLTLDFVARNKVGGTNLNYFIHQQLPVLSPDRYTPAALDFIVPRVLEFTYTACGLQPWADELAAYDARPVLYGLTREELRYILDPADVMGAAHPSEIFRVLKRNEECELGAYRTQRLVLAAWDQ
ncbi:hypothetical protein D8B34_05460 [Verminephrobacter eiseniae]|nr:hypothetical protein [Verminephrobacter eiseniae]MCW5293584.1 hypothetical protein [Verminephrobacter eiseniae]MCW8186122.1 hypothetical protein [Verminephrobacter eiseniae]MCW8224637.1 hypothetical protein [Verminephrobacter eiseniae]MCW8233255.1 hypothetical protein [Verminephrobacter eiseniae]